MKKIFNILLSLALVLSLGLLTAAPVMAAAPALPSISPASAEVNLDSVVQLGFNIAWGSATNISSIKETIGKAPGFSPITLNSTDYVVFDTLLVLTSSYLNNRFDCVGDKEVLLVTFDLGAFFITITTKGTAPSISPTTVNWDFYLGGGANTTVTLGYATAPVDVLDEALASIGGGNWAFNSTTGVLTIKDSYLTPTLTAIGDMVTLTVVFDSCNYDAGSNTPHAATLKVKAVGALKPSISPTSANYKWYAPNSVTTTITWDGASSISEVWWWTSPSNAFNATFFNGWGYTVVGNTLTINPVMIQTISGILAGTGLDLDPCSTLNFMLLRLNFDDGNYADFLVNLSWKQPTLTPATMDFSLDGAPPTVYSIIDWGDAINVISIEAWYTPVSNGTAMNVTGWVPFGTLLTVYYPALGGYIFVDMGFAPAMLTTLGDTLTYWLQFDKGCWQSFTLTATGTSASIAPTKADWNIDDVPHGNVTTQITWGPFATNVTGIYNGLNALPGWAYTVTPPTGTPLITSQLLINGDYLAGVLSEIGKKVTLTIKFNEGNAATLTITAVGTPMCFIATAAGADAPQLDTLRAFRDRYMRTNPLGRFLVNLYYRVSPPIAQFITEHPTLQPIVRAALVPALALSTLAINSSPATLMAILCLLLVSVALAVWASRRRERGPTYA